MPSQISAGDAVNSLNITSANDGALNIVVGPNGSKVNALAFDAAGYPKQQQLPYAAVAYSGTQSLATTSPTKVTLNTSHIAPNKFTLTSGSLVVPVAGIYQVNFQVTFDATTDSQLGLLYKNGSLVGAAGGFVTSGFSARPMASWLVACNAGDTLELWAQRGTTASNVIGGVLQSYLVTAT